MKRLIIDTDKNFDFEPLANAVYNELKQTDLIKAEIVFVDEEKIRKLNQKTRNIDKVTDVLSYPSLDGIKGKIIKSEDYPFDKDEDGSLFIGSIAVCEDVAKRQAEEYGHSFEREINYLCVHGLLHLMGFDHIEENDKKEMREKEENIMTVMNLKRKNI